MSEPHRPGASGAVAGVCIALQRLVDAGHEVRALVRPGKHVAARVTTVEGDLLDPSSLSAAPTTVAEIAALVGADYPESKSPLENPRNGHIDGTLARRLGFVPTVRSMYQAAGEGAL